MHIWHLKIRASSLQFRASKINMALARMDKLVKKLMSNPAIHNNHHDNSQYLDVLSGEIEKNLYIIYIKTSNETSFSLQRLSNCVNNCVNLL